MSLTQLNWWKIKTQFNNHFAINLNSTRSSSVGIPRMETSILFHSAAMTKDEKQAAPVNTAQGITAAAMLCKHERTRRGRRGEDNPTTRVDT